MVSYSCLNNINQPQRRTESITIGRLAPDFIALSTFGYIRLSDYKGKWLIISSSPSAFSNVATTEVIDASLNYDKILERGANMIGLTVDSNNANLAWVYDIYQTTGISVPFPIVSDVDLAISEMYGMLNPDRMYTETVRSTFIIDPSGKIKAIYILPATSGKSFDELLRMFDSILIKEKYNLDTPAGWKPGDQVLLPNVNSYQEIIGRVNNQEALGYNCPFWYVCYTNLNTESTGSNTEIREP